MSLFDAYVIVDWSAAATPKQGADSIWICAYQPGSGQPGTERPPALSNLATRHQAVLDLIDLLSDLTAQGLRVLAGFDFNFGFPQGFVQRLGLKDWSRVWRFIASGLQDQPDNANNRFAWAGEINQRFATPFWGCPAGRSLPGLSATVPPLGDWPALRLTEQRAKGTRPVWQLYGAGSVGSQTITGLPRLEQIRNAPGLDVTVWPFQTGLIRLEDRPAGSVLLAEVWPSLLGDEAVLDQDPAVKDARQVLRLARSLARLDRDGRLADLFAGDPSLDAPQRRLAEREEGWILGVTSGKAAPLAGTLWGIAAGPGPNDLLTLRAVDALRGAALVVLTDPEPERRAQVRDSISPHHLAELQDIDNPAWINTCRALLHQGRDVALVRGGGDPVSPALNDLAAQVGTMPRLAPGISGDT